MYKSIMKAGGFVLALVLLSPHSVNAYTFTQFLQRGMTNSEVRELQMALKNDTSVYPESIVSGYFGSLTEKRCNGFRQSMAL